MSRRLAVSPRPSLAAGRRGRPARRRGRDRLHPGAGDGAPGRAGRAAIRRAQPLRVAPRAGRQSVHLLPCRRPGRAHEALRQPALPPARSRPSRGDGPLRRAGLLQPGPRFLQAGVGPGARGGVLGPGQGLEDRRQRAGPAAARRPRFPRRLAADLFRQRPGLARPRAIPAAPGPAQQRDPLRRESSSALPPAPPTRRRGSATRPP